MNKNSCMHLYKAKIHIATATPSQIVALAEEFCCIDVRPSPERCVSALFDNAEFRDGFLDCIRNRFHTTPTQPAE